MLAGGAPVRVLAIYSNDRLPGKLSDVPTAKEQGFDIQWPIIRGFYMGPKVSNADYEWWVNAFNKTMASSNYAELRTQQGLFPFDLTGAKLDGYIKQRVQANTELADSFGLIKK